MSIFGSQSDTTNFLRTAPTETRFASACFPARFLSSQEPHATSGTMGYPDRNGMRCLGKLFLVSPRDSPLFFATVRRQANP